MKYQILVDSSSDLDKDYLKGTDIGFEVIPLTILIGEHEFVDDETMDTAKMYEAFYSHNGKSGTACPAPQLFADHFDKADYTFIVTITSKLSGCYNSALVAANGADKKNVYVIDSKATSGSMILIVDKLVELINQGLEFGEITEQIEEYRKNLRLFFMLQTFDNLVANGRMSKFAGFMAKRLSIKPVCAASPEGTIQVLQKTIGSLNAYKKMTELMGTTLPTLEGRRVIITHSNNLKDAEIIKSMILDKYPVQSVEIRPMHGLTSYYAMDKGLIICY